MLKIISYYRKKKEKNLVKNNIIPGIIYNNKNNILIKIKNNSYYYNILKIKKDIKIIILNKNYITLIKSINYHPYLNIIIHIEFINLNEKI